MFFLLIIHEMHTEGDERKNDLFFSLLADKNGKFFFSPMELHESL